MIVKNNITEYNLLSSYSILDYFFYIEAVKHNQAILEKNGQSQNKI